MATVGDVLIVLASLVIGLGHATGYMEFEGAVVWLAVYAVLMLADIKTQVEGDA